MPSHQTFVSVDLHVSPATAFCEFMSFEFLASNAVLFDVAPRRFAVGDEVVLSFRGDVSATHTTTKVVRFVQDQMLSLEFVGSVEAIRSTHLQLCFETFGVSATKFVVVKVQSGFLYNALDEFAAEEKKLLALASGFRDWIHAKYPRRSLAVGTEGDGLLSVNVAPPRWRYGASNCHLCKTQISDAVVALMDRKAPQTHCRNCGFLFCTSCCSQRVAVPTYATAVPQKVCKTCARELSDTATASETSAAEIAELQRQVQAQVAAAAAAAAAAQIAADRDDDDDEDRDGKSKA
jgi:hypothetical protein